MTNTNTLPDKPSELIRVALADLVKVERSPKYVVNMEDWHVPIISGVCEVCFAGAVMAKTLEADRDVFFNPEDMMSMDIEHKLIALDYFRMGDASCRMDYMGLPADDNHDRDIAEYEDDPKAFKKDMRKLAKDLEKEGL